MHDTTAVCMISTMGLRVEDSFPTPFPSQLPQPSPRAGDPGRLAHMTTCAAGDGCLHPLKALIQPEAFNKHSCQGVCVGTLHGMCGSSLPDPITGQLDDNRRTCFRCGDGAGAAAAPAAPAAPPAAAAAAVHLQPVAEAATAATTQVSTHTHTHTHQCHHALL